MKVIGLPAPAAPRDLESGSGTGLGEWRSFDAEVRECQDRVDRGAALPETLVQLRVAEVHHDEERRHIPARLREHTTEASPARRLG